MKHRHDWTGYGGGAKCECGARRPSRFVATSKPTRLAKSRLPVMSMQEYGRVRAAARKAQ